MYIRRYPGCAMARGNINNWHVILDDELAQKLEDFRTVFYRGEKTEIVKEALNAYIDSVLEKEPERKKRYDAIRKQRQGGAEPIRLVTSGRSPKGRTSRTDRP